MSVVSPAQIVPATSELPFGATLGLVTTLKELLALETDWRVLETRARISPSVFQSFDWISNWSKVYATAGSDTELLVVAGYHEKQLVFLWPLMKIRAKGLRTLAWLTEPSGQYGDVLVAADHSPAIWLSASLRVLRQLKNIDLIRLRHVRKDASIAEYADRHFNCANLHERAPFLDLSEFPDDASYEARYTAAQRKRRKKIRKNLEEMGQVEFLPLPPGVLADKAMSSAIDEKNMWLKERGRMNLILRCPKHLEFLKLLARGNTAGVQVVTSELTAGGKPVSWEIGFRFRGTHFAYITSHVTALTDLSPGRLHMDMSQRLAIAAGQKRFDLMVPYDQHKESWSSANVDTRDFYVPMNTWGRVYGSVYLRKIRPILRNIYYRLPRNVLTVLQMIAGR